MEDELSYIKYVEDQAKINAEFSLGITESLIKDAGMLLNILIVGIGGSFGLAVNIGDKGQYLLVSLLAASAWLVITASVLTYKCIRTRDIFAPSNDPKGLMFDGYLEYSQLQVRKFALERIQESISANRSGNKKVALWLDRCRFMAISTPVVAILAALASYHAQALGYASLFR